ncbi:hypothetical protein E8E13_002665 [Curvularia kusanoi]|uniref:Uncharacterized protein n=1 Tax=Curvularia kusanoi TaxID=90978 RepID=A0A9P4W4N1_CURKU|nr:hypothetical protein E8E13_002665 [Curvularia kusanoi]
MAVLVNQLDAATSFLEASHSGTLILTDLGLNEINWNQAAVYDHSCRKIGSQGSPISPDDAITSELKWTVVLTLLDSFRDYNWIGMCYADYCFEGYFACSLDPKGYNLCAHSFPC